jgi:hypothetical protein
MVISGFVVMRYKIMICWSSRESEVGESWLLDTHWLRVTMNAVVLGIPNLDDRIVLFTSFCCRNSSVADLIFISWIMNQCDTSWNSCIADFILFRWIMSQCETSDVFRYKRWFWGFDWPVLRAHDHGSPKMREKNQLTISLQLFCGQQNLDPNLIFLLISTTQIL